MTDGNFQRLLDAEERAEKIVSDARSHRDEIIDTTLKQVTQEEQRFEQRIPEIHETFRSRAMQRADQVVDEIKRRYAEKVTNLRELAEQRENDALAAALSILTKSKK